MLLPILITGLVCIEDKERQGAVLPYQKNETEHQ
jgi:hypothetical protein